ncbi:MAG: hypothetical protein LLG93_11955 [Deltaproteobacteria bacterium]|nr:hypothetical protein [Deltaproteobacteria bacterium]
MKKVLCLVALLVWIGGCGGSRPAPAWFASGHQQLETFKTDFLTGRATLIVETHFQKAVEEIKKGGDLDLLGKAWLTRMALQRAVLEEMGEEEIRKIEAAQAVPANDNFHRFLAGDPRTDASLLPAPYQPFLAALQGGNAQAAAAAVAGIDDPLSRLIAAGLALQGRLETEALLQRAVETASQNGWKRALLAWLKRLGSFYEASGEAAKAATVRQRIALIQ